MSIMKSCQDILDNGAIEDRYNAAAFVIKHTIHYKNLELKERRELFSSMIDDYCRRYSLAKTMLGKRIQGSL